MISYDFKDGRICTGAESIPVYGEYDVVVVGGGMAGTGAAIAAAKGGAKTIIVENTSALGGIATMGIVNIPLDFVSGVGAEFFTEMDKINGLRARNSDPEKHKLTFDRLVKKYGCEMLLVTPLIDTIVDGNEVKGIIVHTKQGKHAILGKAFVDASGDSDLVYFAGGETMTGREEDGMSMGCSLEFVLGGVDFDTYYNSDLNKNDPKWYKFIPEQLAKGNLPYEIDNHLNWLTHIPDRPEHCGMDEVSICFAHSRNCYPTDNADLTRMYIEGREQAVILAKFIRENVPGFERSYLSYTGSLLGVRESRRIVGEYIFTGSDIAYARKFDDVIAISQHGFDLHGFKEPGNMKWFKGKLPDGTDAYIANRAGWGSQLPPDDGLKRVNMVELIPQGAMYCYDIPYRSLVPVRLENVLAAGRNLSADIPGQSGTRLVMCCMALGEAAGTACALAVKSGKRVRDIDVGELQRTLVSNGVNIGQRFREIPALVGANVSSSEEKYVGGGVYRND
ncbi:MAG: FAD-dependent oxidoreductase [Clostridia bacterium]|nr:FAD-dependent oxidoreductase [Clostridia bacterium]